MAMNHKTLAALCRGGSIYPSGGVAAIKLAGGNGVLAEDQVPCQTKNSAPDGMARVKTGGGPNPMRKKSTRATENPAPGDEEFSP